MEGLWVEADLRKRIVPVWQTQVHDHQAEVVSESIRDEKPLAGQVLEPDLRLGLLRLEDKR